MRERPLICGFLKVRNEIIREGNLYRVLANMRRYCDVVVACDDGSTDGTLEVLRDQVVPACVIAVPPGEQDFRKELAWKQKMLETVHRMQPHWVLWHDGDEVFDRAGTVGIRAFAQQALTREELAWKFHYTQFWRTTAWARTDAQFDDGWFIKLWRWQPDLAFTVVEGTHHAQFPRQIAEALGQHAALVGAAPFEVLHYGNFGKNLVWKCVQYWGGLGGVERHLHFGGGAFRPVSPELIPEGAEWVPGERPQGFTTAEVRRIEALRNLRGLEKTFCVVIPAYNRALTLPRALASILAQTYERWVALVLDDGSTDDTPAVMRTWQDRDPRIFYCRYPVNRGGVAVNEIGMTLACEMAEWWTRLGSDDWWEPRKLEHDARALEQAGAVYGPFQVVRGDQDAEVCNPPRSPGDAQHMLLQAGFVCSWANCAVRTSVLRQIRARYGMFGDPRLRNMEDYLINARIARVADWWWRGCVDGQFILNPPPPQIAWVAERAHQLEREAVWTVAADGASSNADQYVRDEQLTRQIIQEENRG